MNVKIVLLLLNNVNMMIAKERQQFRRTPDNQTATIYDTVTLACSVTNKQGVLQWTRDGFGLGTDRNLSSFDRYHMIGSEEEGDFTLVIDRVTLEDDAIFQCQVSPGQNNTALRSTNAKLTVEVPTNTPQILQPRVFDVTEDQSVEIECISNGGKPPAEITWLDGNNQVIKSNTKVFNNIQDDKRWNVKSVLTLVPKKDMNNKTLTCQAHNRPSKSVMNDFIRLNVKYSPKVALKIETENIREGDNIKIKCSADSNPIKMTYRWYINNTIIIGESNEVLFIKNINRTYHKNIIRCEVENSIGTSEASGILQVTYGPRFQEKFKNAQAELNSPVTISCIADGNPKPEIFWYHGQKRIVLSSSPNLTIVATQKTIGKYTCQAVVQGFDKISREISIELKGPPKIQSSRIQFGQINEMIELECYATAVPKPDKITWSHLGKDIVPSAFSNYKIKEELTQNGIKLTLTIKSSQEPDFGSYNCTVSNEYGSSVMEIYLLKQKNPQLVIMVTAAIVLLIVVIATITLICQKSSTNKKENELINSDNDDICAEKNNINILNKSNKILNSSDLNIEIQRSNSILKVESCAGSSGTYDWRNEEESGWNKSKYVYGSNNEDINFPQHKSIGGHDGYNVNYSIDYNQPMQREQTKNSMDTLNSFHIENPIQSIDPKYSAYYLRKSDIKNVQNPISHHVTDSGGRNSNSSTQSLQYTYQNHDDFSSLPSPAIPYQLNKSTDTIATPLPSYNNANKAHAPLQNHVVVLPATMSTTPMPKYVPLQIRDPQLKSIGKLATHV